MFFENKWKENIGEGKRTKRGNMFPTFAKTDGNFRAGAKLVYIAWKNDMEWLNLSMNIAKLQE